MSEPTRPARVVVLRHGPAEMRDPGRWPDDALRPLSAKGTQQTRKLAAGLVRQLRSVSCVATSPALRTRRTAELVGRALRPPRRPEVWPELDVGSLASTVFPRLRRVAGPDRTVVLVGHEPALAEFVGLALTGDSAALARLTKGGAACLEFPRSMRPGSGRLLWLLTRKQLAGADD